VRVGEWVALGLREHGHGLSPCRVGVVLEVSTFGVMIRDIYGDRTTVRWAAVEEIRHAEYLSAAAVEALNYDPAVQHWNTGDLLTFEHEWNLSPADLLQRNRRNNDRRRTHRRSKPMPGYL
jgi:hypothetical protein